MKDLGLIISAFGALGLVACYGAAHGWNCVHRYGRGQWPKWPMYVLLGCIPAGIALMALSKAF